MALPMATQNEMITELAEQTGYSKSDVRHFLDGLTDFITSEIKACNRVKVAGIQVEPKLKKATKKRKGRNPQTGEEVMISAKPASVRVAAKVVKPLKDAAPSVKKLTAAL